jgi:hypothetical protein
LTATAQQQNINSVASWRVAIIDDVYAGPRIADVKDRLEEFCAVIEGNTDLEQKLFHHTGCNFGDVREVTDPGIIALHHCRSQLTEIDENLDELFLNFDQRLDEVKAIEENLKTHGFAASNIKPFHSANDLESFSGEPFHLVFLDFLLTDGDNESMEIAKRIYEKFKAFILLMSNSPVKNNQVEGFRRKTKLLSGFFVFHAKSNLCNPEDFRIQIETLPKDPKVCHAVHNFVIALENALGREIPELPFDEESSPVDAQATVLPQFMHTLRTLGLHDYALLCEMTLRLEGHPLGDYMMRLLGSHLVTKLLSHQGVKDAVAALDRLRFTEFLPFGDETSPSFHRMYADATTEAISSPWGQHPWSEINRFAGNGISFADPVGDIGELGDTVPPDSDSRSVEIEEAAVDSEILQLLGFNDDNQPLPYVQLGDLFIKDVNSLVFAVITAPCELQFVPSQVHQDRVRMRDDTVLLVPGRFRSIGAAQAKKSQTLPGLIEWNGSYYCVDWFGGKLLGLPHCSLLDLFQRKGYLHQRRFQATRALELQQIVFSKLSRIGLEVRPPFPRDIKISLFGLNNNQTFGKLGDAVARGGLLFHGRKLKTDLPEERILVFRRSAFFHFAEEMKKHAEQVAAVTSNQPLKTNLAAAVKEFMGTMGGLKLPITIPVSPKIKPIQFVHNSGTKSMNQVAIRFGDSAETLEITSQNVMFCFSVEEEE